MSAVQVRQKDISAAEISVNATNAPYISLYDREGNIRRLIEIEIDIINLAMVLYGGCSAEVARRLGIGRSTLYRKLDIKISAK